MKPIDRELIRAHLVILNCPHCGEKWQYLGKDPRDCETPVECPNCSEGTPEYGDWIESEIALLGNDFMVFLQEGRWDVFRLTRV